MPQFFARARDAQGSYATIKKDGGLGFSHEGNATVFDSAQQAMDAVEAALKTSYANHPPQSSPWNYPVWMQPALTVHDSPKGPRVALMDQAASVLCRVDCKAGVDDVMGAFELHYARGPLGWLGGPRTKARWGQFEWHASFSDARAFASREALLDALESAQGNHEYSIVTSSCALTALERVGTFVDDASSSISSAIEARDISHAIREAADGRLDAMAGSSPSKARRGSRL